MSPLHIDGSFLNHRLQQRLEHILTFKAVLSEGIVALTPAQPFARTTNHTVDAALRKGIIAVTPAQSFSRVTDHSVDAGLRERIVAAPAASSLGRLTEGGHGWVAAQQERAKSDCHQKCESFHPSAVPNSLQLLVCCSGPIESVAS